MSAGNAAVPPRPDAMLHVGPNRKRRRAEDKLRRQQAKRELKAFLRRAKRRNTNKETEDNNDGND